MLERRLWQHLGIIRSITMDTVTFVCEHVLLICVCRDDILEVVSVWQIYDIGVTVIYV